MEYLGFLIGQAIAVGYQWTHYKTDEKPWLAYWDKRHIARHVSDLLLAVVAFIAWGTGLIHSFAGYFGAGEAVAKLPGTPEGLAASVVVGFGMAFTVRGIQRWIERTEKPDEPKVP